MISFVEEYMSQINQTQDDDFDEQKIMLKSISAVMPLVIKNELTQKQSLCLRLFYIHGKSQMEIARQLKLSQPTVSRHIKTAKDIMNKYLGYCTYCVNKANELWLKMN